MILANIPSHGRWKKTSGSIVGKHLFAHGKKVNTCVVLE
jgi:hypothetical protein